MEPRLGIVGVGEGPLSSGTTSKVRFTIAICRFSIRARLICLVLGEGSSPAAVSSGVVRVVEREEP